MASSFKEVTAYQVTLANPAVSAGEAVRFQEFEEALSGLPGGAHTHAAGVITGFEEAVDDRVSVLLAASDSIEFGYDDAGGSISGTLRLAAGSGLVISTDGVSADFGTAAGTVAEGDHTHAELHDAATVLETDTLTLVLAGQQVSGDVRLANGGGLEALADSGIAAVFGTTSGTVAAGDHTHTELHDAMTRVNSTSVTLSLSGQELTATVIVDPAPLSNHGRVLVGAAGLYVETGSGSGVAAPGVHVHGVVSATADGFMSIADKVKLDGLTDDVDEVLTEALANALYTASLGLSAGQLWLGNDSGVAAAVTPSGDLTISSTGVVSLANSSGDDTMLGDRTVDDALATPANTGTLTQLLSWVASEIRQIKGLSTWLSAEEITLSAAYAHSIATTNPHSVTAAQLSLDNLTNDAQVPLAGGTMTGDLRVNANLGLGIAPLALLHLNRSAGDVRALFSQGSTALVSLGAADATGVDLHSGTAALGDFVVRTHQVNAGLWHIDSNGAVRLSLKTVVDSGPGTQLGVYHGNGLGVVRSILVHGATADGYGNLGGLQIVAQGADLSTTGAGAIHFFTPSANSAGPTTDAAVAVRMTISQSGNVDITTDAALLKVPRKSTSGDPTGAAGGVYYNSNSGKFRVYEGAAWVDMVGGGAATPGGADTQIQFNNASTMDGTSDLTWSTGSKILNVAGDLYLGGSKVVNIGGSAVLRTPATGWNNAGTYSTSRADINSGSIGLTALADIVATLIADCKYHGFLT